MKKYLNMRAQTDMRHYNDQNPNINPGRTRARTPQLVRDSEFTGQVRTILVRPPNMHPAQLAVPLRNGAPLAVSQAVGAKRYE